MILKKLLAIVLIVIMCASVCYVNASEKSNGTFQTKIEITNNVISNSPIILNADYQIAVKVSVTQNSGINFLRFVTYFDTEAFEYNGYESFNLFGATEVITERNGYVIFFVDLSENTTEVTGDIFVLNLRTKNKCSKEAKIYTELANKREANCGEFTPPSAFVPVPFIEDCATIEIHSIYGEGVVTQPTCTEEGYTSYSCTDCEEKVKGNTKSAIGHDLTHYDAKAATCTEGGWKAYSVCKRDECGYSNFSETNALGHLFSAPVIIEKDGKNHSYFNCQRCEIEKESFVGADWAMGDADGDGKVNVVDLAILKKTVAGLFNENTDIPVIVDMDGDKQINVVDLAILKRKVAGLV